MPSKYAGQLFRVGGRFGNKPIPYSVLRQSKEYRIWKGMLSRCLYDTDHRYENYGGRGISFDPRWQDFLPFLADMGPMPDETYSLDRIEVDKHYTKNNCRWIPEKEQNYNKTTTRYITYKGESKCLAEWCEVLQLDYQSTYNAVVRRGQSLEDYEQEVRET